MMQSELVMPRAAPDHLGMRAGQGLRLRNRLRVARAERSMSQEALANAVGVSRNTISSIETGRYEPSALLAFRLAEALDVPVARLFWIEGELR
jgi:putative transcriptional regulator